MKRLLLWTFERGSFQWDVLCLLILAFMFLIPANRFHDTPEFMKVSDGESVRTNSDRSGNTIYTVKLDQPLFVDRNETRELAVSTLRGKVGSAVHPGRIQPIRDWTGRLIAYAIWNER